MPRLSVCADAQKVDRSKLAQTEVLVMLTVSFFCTNFDFELNTYAFKKKLHKASGINS